MRITEPLLALVAIVGLVACSHQTAPLAAAVASSKAHTASADDEARARALITKRLAEPNRKIVDIELSLGAWSGNYDYFCTYMVPKLGLQCVYEASGNVDVPSGLISVSRSIRGCVKE